MNSRDFDITAETKIAALLKHYPGLEDHLIGMAPPFKKLKNPILRRSVAKVASLHQAAAVGRLPVPLRYATYFNSAIGLPTSTTPMEKCGL